MRAAHPWTPDPVLDPLFLIGGLIVFAIIIACAWIEIRKGCREKKPNPTWWQKGGL